MNCNIKVDNVRHASSNIITIF
uniref:Uncharacterized protein n=1 Tax=Rhizophora mucronata TaxID=61149 RepID=A0A2P2QFZ4_RHIMU